MSVESVSGTPKAWATVTRGWLPSRVARSVGAVARHDGRTTADAAVGQFRAWAAAAAGFDRRALARLRGEIVLAGRV